MSVKWSQLAQVGEVQQVSNDTVEITLMNGVNVSYGFNDDEALLWKSGLRPKEMVKVTVDNDTYWTISKWGTLFH